MFKFPSIFPLRSGKKIYGGIIRSWCRRCVILSRHTYSLSYTSSVILLAITACSSFRAPITDTMTCKNQAYIGNKFSIPLTSRDGASSQARLAILPFDVPESFAPKSPWHQDFGIRLGQYLTQELLRSGDFPIVEFQDQATWLGKREEFFSGNFQGINAGRQAGFDLIFVGYVDQLDGTNKLDIYGKIIDVANATTLWYGKTQAVAETGLIREAEDGAKTIAGVPFGNDNFADMNALARTGAACLSKQLLKGSDNRE